MIRVFFILLTIVLSLNGAYLEVKNWKKGQTFLTFLEDNSIPLSVYYDLDDEDKELATEIQSDANFEILKDDDGKIEQVLIPVGEELQLHIVKNKNSGTYSMKTTPVFFKKQNFTVVVDIQKSPYQDIISTTNSRALANEFVNVYKKSIDFKGIKKGDKLVIFYTQKERLGKRYGHISIDAAMIEVRGNKNFVFLYDDNRYLNEKGKELQGYAFELPLRSYKRISSKFTYKRWHPILKRYRAHLGIDYAARRGTRVLSAGTGRVSFVGRKSGYGKVIEIRHEGGYKTLYAHLNGFKKGLKRGKRVKKGQLIGYVGNTGRSTGPHLHFGLYKNNRAINPNKVVHIARNGLRGKKKRNFLAHVKRYKKRFEVAINNNVKPKKEEKFNYIVSLENNNINTN